MKKTFVLSLFALGCLGLIYANGQKDAPDKGAAAGKKTVTWLYETAAPENEQAFREHFIDPVNGKAKDYTLTVRFDPNYDQKLRTSMLAGVGPDIVQTAGPSYVQEFAEKDYLLPLDGYAEKYGWKQKYFPMMIDLGSYNGKLYALPKTYEAMVLFYNKTLFDKKGWRIPTTWDEYDRLCVKIKAAGIVPIVSGNASWKPTNEHYVTIFFNHLAGPDNLRKALKGEIPWNSPVFVDAVKKLTYYYKEFFTEDYFSYSQDDALAVLASGDAAMYPSGTWNFQNIDKFFKESGTEWDWAPLPSAAGVPYPVYDLGIGATLSINAKSPNADQAAEILNALSADPQSVADLNAAWPGEWNIPINTISKSDFEGKVDPRYARNIDEIGKAVNKGGYGFTTWTFWPAKTDQYLWEAIEKVWLDQLSPEEYLRNMDKIFREELEAGQVPPLPKK